MSLSVNVLTPTGRRQIVKVNNNTSILQILEDVCKKQGVSPAEYDLKHYNTRLDMSSTVRFSNLPNNAQLELVKAVSCKVEANVIIVLQLPNGERLQAEFPATQTLYGILFHWQKEKGESLLQRNDEDGNTMEPVCIYIRREVVGEEVLKATTLRSLGLTNGKAIIRLNYRTSGKPLQQAYVEALVLPHSKEESFSKHQQSQFEEVHSYGIENWDDELQNNEQTSSKDDYQMQHSSSDATTGSWNPLPNQDWGRGQSSSNNDDAIEPSTSDASWDPLTSHDWGRGQSFRDTLTNSNDKSKPFSDDGQEVVLDKEERKRPAEKDLDWEEKLIYLDDKGSLLYRLDESCKRPFNDYLPDDFFAVTLDDVRLLLSDLTRQRKEMENMPLQTRTLREADYLVRLNKYPKSVLRVNFPDRFVLQGSFKSIDTVEKVINFVKSFLEDEDISFHLYTTPPKNILKPEDRLFELALVPAAVIHFSSNVIKEHYLKPDVSEKVSSMSAANHSSRIARSLEKLEPIKCDTDSHEECCTTSVYSSDDTRLPQLPSTSNAPQQRTNQSTGAIPKWFKTGKK